MDLEKTTKQSVYDNPVALLRKIPTWIWPAYGIFLFFSKLISISHGNLLTALAISSSTPSIATAIFSAIISSLTLLLMVLVFFWSTNLMESIREGDPINASVILTILGLLMGAVLLPIQAFIILIAFG